MNNSSEFPFLKGEEPQLQWYFLGIVALLICSCIVCNGIIVAVFILERAVRNQANMFVLSLACADLVVGFVSMPLWVANSAPNVKLNYYHTSVDILCSSASIFNCALLSIERALKITFPYRYANGVTTFRVKIAILSAWMAAFFVASLSFLRHHDPNNLPYIIFLSIVVYILPVFAIFLSYISIFFVAHKHAKNIRKQQLNIVGESTFTRISEAKTAWRLGVFIVVYVICWTPLFVKIWGKILLENTPPPPLYNVVAIFLTNINAVINPFLYALFTPAFRKGMAKLFKRKKAKTHNNSKESSRRNEISTAQTNLHSPSVSRVVSSQGTPQTDRREIAFTPDDLCNGHLNVHTNLLVHPQADEENDHNEINRNHKTEKCCMFETSL